MLFLSVALCTALGASFAGLIEFSLPGLAALVMVCLGAASLVVFLYQAAGSLMGGVMLLFLAVTAMHFLSGDFFPGIPAHHLPGCSAVSAHLCADGGYEAGGHIFF